MGFMGALIRLLVRAGPSQESWRGRVGCGASVSKSAGRGSSSWTQARPPEQQNGQISPQGGLWRRLGIQRRAADWKLLAGHLNQRRSYGASFTVYFSAFSKRVRFDCYFMSVQICAISKYGKKDVMTSQQNSLSNYFDCHIKHVILKLQFRTVAGTNRVSSFN